MAEPVSLAEIKEHLRIDADVTDEDVTLGAMLIGARVACEAETNRSIVGSTATMHLDSFPEGSIDLTGGQVTSVASVEYLAPNGDAETLPSDRYVAALGEVPGRIAPVIAWPATAAQPEAVTITYVISPLSSDHLAAVCMAIRLIVGHWYKNREAVAVDQRGVPAELPLSVNWLLRPVYQFATS